MDDQPRVKERLKRLEVELAALEEGSPALLLDRLRAEAPLSPYLLGRIGGFIVSVLCMAVAVFSLGAGLFGMAYEAARLDAMLGYPLPLLATALSMCAAAIGLVGSILARSRGRESPLLQREAREKQHILTEMNRLRSQQDIEERVRKKRRSPMVTPVGIERR